MKDIYVKFTGPDLKGESSDVDHKDWIEIESWSHGIRQPKSATASTSGGHTAERCEHEDMIFVKSMDVTSPQLYEAASGGTTYAEVTVDFMRADGDDKRVKYMEVKLKNVIISKINVDTAVEGAPKETFALKYAAVEWKYTKQQIAGGQGGITQGAWSLAKNNKSYTA
jgi:type VI secretion system secreted protein Hcp